jgi:hypothetical protein
MKDVIEGLKRGVESEMEEYVLIKIDRHESRKTGAFTKWILPHGSKPMGSNYTEFKTHWVEYWLVPKNSELERIRRSNRGNLSRTKYKAEELKVSDEEAEILRLEGCQF